MLPTGDSDRWLLPDGVEEVLPDDAWRMELKRRQLLQTFHSWGFELVVPPMVEYIESLLTGAGAELSTRTFTVTDQLTGRLMGVRADMTPQVARIDAHYAASIATRNHTDSASVCTRLCYAGPTLQTIPRTLGGSREPFQFGAELFGVPQPEGDGEIIALMVECMTLLGLSELCLDLGHVGVFRALMKHFAVDDDDQGQILDALISKSTGDIESAAIAARLTPAGTEALTDLTVFTGGTEVIAAARDRYHEIDDLLAALNNLEAVVKLVHQFTTDVDITIDLAGLRGYRYHTGIVYSLLTPGVGKPVARGGRYDGVGIVFGRDRPATGFSGDLRQLLAIRSPAETSENTGQIVAAPCVHGDGLETEIRRLRAEGYRVVRLSSGQNAATIPNLAFKLVANDSERTENGWSLIRLPDEGKTEFQQRSDRSAS